MKTLIVISALIAMLICIPSAGAGDCRRVNYVQATSYVQPTYYPSYDYNNYALIVARAVPVYMNLNSYTSVGDVARDYFSTKQATKEGFLEAMREMQANGAPIPPAAANPNAAASPPAAGPAASLAPKVYTTINDVIANRCVSCHNPKDQARTDWSIGPDKISGPLARAGALKCTLGLMPKKGPQLPDQELSIIATWADQKPEK